jgi:hypothetical protein
LFLFEPRYIYIEKCFHFIYHHYLVVQHHRLLLQLPRPQLLVVVLQLIEHNMLDSIEHLRLKVVAVVVVVVVVADQVVEQLIEAEFVVLFVPK